MHRHFTIGEDEDHFGYLNDANNLLGFGKNKKSKRTPKQTNEEPFLHLQDPHAHDERVKPHSTPRHYYEDHHKAYSHEELEWPVGHDLAHPRKGDSHLAPVSQHHEELDWPATAHERHFYDTADEKHPATGDFSLWTAHNKEKWYDVDHDVALKHRERQLYGTHYAEHDTKYLPWLEDDDHDHDLDHAEAPVHADPVHTEHYRPRSAHSQLEWPHEHRHHEGF